MNRFIKLLEECKDALITRDAVKCYNLGSVKCKCTLCKIENELKHLKQKL